MTETDKHGTYYIIIRLENIHQLDMGTVKAKLIDGITRSGAGIVEWVFNGNVGDLRKIMNPLTLKTVTNALKYH
jgi:hypothetical protein